MNRLDPVQQEWVDFSGKEHVEVLWRMPCEQRLRLWEVLGRYDDPPLEVLELGQSGNSMDDEEMSFVMQVVLSERLDSLRVLYVENMCKLTDASLQALANQGCGKSLTSLHLGSECRLPFGALLFFFSAALFSRSLAIAFFPPPPSSLTRGTKCRAGCWRDGRQFTSAGREWLRQEPVIAESSV